MADANLAETNADRFGSTVLDTIQQRHLAVAADAELRRRHPDEHYPSLRSAEPEPATSDQREELTMAAGEEIRELPVGQDLAAAYEGLDVPEWNCDADGISRNIARPMDGWDFRKRRQLQQLASWPIIEQAVHEADRYRARGASRR